MLFLSQPSLHSALVIYLHRDYFLQPSFFCFFYRNCFQTALLLFSSHPQTTFFLLALIFFQRYSFTMLKKKNWVTVLVQIEQKPPFCHWQFKGQVTHRKLRPQTSPLSLFLYPITGICDVSALLCTGRSSIFVAFLFLGHLLPLSLYNLIS